MAVHREGFELCSAPSRVATFRDDEAVKRVYYPECAELACAATGGRRAYVFDHQVRKREEGGPPLTFGRHGDGSQPAAAGRMHNDYTEVLVPSALGSQVSGVARYVAHAAFDLPSIPPEAPLRESIEVRCLVVLD